jgi:uncharacterized protein (TIGR02231 family)
MKRNLFLIAFACMYFVSDAQNSLQVNSTINGITVYLQGAQISRTATANLPAGQSWIVLSKLSDNVNTNAIEVSGKGNFVILDVQYQLNYLDTTQPTPEAKKLKDSFDFENNNLKRVLDNESVVKGEMDVLNANKNVSGTTTGLNLTQLQQFLDYYNTKLTAYKSQEFDLEQNEKNVRATIARLQNQLNQITQKNNHPSGEIVVNVQADAAIANAEFDFSYVVNNAGWSPSYDIRSDNINSPVQLTYKADVHQSSNEDWNNQKLILSTSNPSVSVQAPTFNPWYVDFYQPMPVMYKSNSVQMAPAAGMQSEDRAATTSADYTTINPTQLSVQYQINLPYTVPSDGKMHSVAIQDFKMDATYQYFSLPKEDADAFLQAHVTGLSQYNLLPGNANIYFEGAYVGQSYLDASNTKDTLDISLGRDKMIIVDREKVKDFSKQQFIGGNVKQSFAYEITVRNTKNVAVQLQLIDQYPISQNSDINISLDDAGNATVDQNTGKLIWNLNLKPGDQQKVRFVFTVKYPKDKPVSGL